MPEAGTTVYLIRHVESRYGGRVTARGLAQACALVPLLRTLQIEAIYSSPYARARHTVAPFAAAEGKRIRIVRNLRERKVSTTQLRDFEAVMRRSWEEFDFRLRGCESSASAMQRVVRTVHRLCRTHGDGVIGISSHGNLLGLLISSAEPAFGYDAWRQMRNPDIYRMHFRQGALKYDGDWRMGTLL